MGFLEVSIENGIGMKKGMPTVRERAEMLVDVLVYTMRKEGRKPTPANIKYAKNWLEGRLDMDAIVDDQLMERVAGKLMGDRTPKKNPVKPRKGESERKFVSRCMSEEKESFPAPKQRIAVCLSKARKNPLLESGATISRNSGINRRAASMT